ESRRQSNPRHAHRNTHHQRHKRNRTPSPNFSARRCTSIDGAAACHPAATSSTRSTSTTSIPKQRHRSRNPIHSPLRPRSRRRHRSRPPTGPNGRVTREDVQSYVKSALQNTDTSANSGNIAFAGLPAWPNVDFAHYGEIERTPLSRI